MGDTTVSLLARLNHQPTPPQAMLREGVLEAVGGIDLISHLLGQINKLSEMVSEREAIWTYFHAFKNRQGLFSHILIIHWRRHELEKVFFREQVQAFSARHKHARLHVANLARKWRWPATYKLQSLLEPYFGHLDRGSPRVEATLHHPRNPLLLTGLSPEHRSEHTLIGLFPLKPILDQSAALRRRMLLSVLACLLVSLYLSHVLASRFLQPIGALARGIEDVAQQKFSTRIPCLYGDEFGRLAQLFNRMTENLEELNLAVEVQSRLFPQNDIQVGNYRVQGRSRTASELGGDYFDYLVLQDRFILVIVGDVTGHGTPAALAMTMAKAVVGEGARLNHDWETIFQALNHVFHENFHGDLLMTTVMCWYDIVEHQGLTLSCGHPYPLLQQSGGELHAQKSRGFPLGFRGTFKPKPSPVTLAPGGRLVFFTDGLLECIPAGPDESQYDLFRAFLATIAEPTAGTWPDAALEAHRRRFSPHSQDDDHTIVTITRTHAR